MKRYNLTDKEDFRELEVLAYNGTAPLEQLPAAAYKYFSELEKASRMYKQGTINQSELQAKRQALLKIYRQETGDAQYYRQIIAAYHSNIKAAGVCLAAIEKAKTVETIAEQACRCIEAMTGETGFSARQMQKLKGE